jgi:hypothetical protein
LSALSKGRVTSGKKSELSIERLNAINNTSKRILSRSMSTYQKKEISCEN